MFFMHALSLIHVKWIRFLLMRNRLNLKGEREQSTILILNNIYIYIPLLVFLYLIKFRGKTTSQLGF